ncbi:MAG: hypothetical protein FJX75_18765 [Armatimonadetes bacterium]|nr:hypothetical protein [Armatimonadota bacterium]
MTTNGRRRTAATAWACLLLAWGAAAAAQGYVTARMVPEGWKLAGEPQAFQADNLHEQIDGAAAGYLRYSFRLLTVQSVQLADDPKTEILVEVYEFGNHLDAFGIYSNERTPKLEYLKLGAEGYYAGATCRFYKGSYYVKVAASRDTQQVQAALQALATGLARRLKGETKPPGLLKAIPSEGLIANSERYEGSDLLAHEFLGRGFTADYDLGGEKPAKLFFAIKADRWEARGAHYKLLSFLRQRGEVGEKAVLAKGSGRMTRHPFYGPSLICRSGPVVCGVLRTPGTEAATKLVEGLIANLESLGAAAEASPSP